MSKILLIIVIFIAFFLRVFQLGVNPPSLTWDEAAWGYNAYSLGIDGRDEFGRFLPYDYLESFGDFKPPLYAYAALLPIKILGLTDFGVRLPSAFFGILAVFFTYLLARRILPEYKYREQIGLITVGMLAISPWHILLSRAAFEANVASSLLILGAWLFLKGVQENSKYVLWSVLPFVLTFYTFNSTRVFVPLLVLLLVISYWKKFLKTKKRFFIAGILAILLLLPIYQFLISPQAKLRYQEVNIFTNIEVIERANQEIANDGNTWWSNILHNRRVKFGKEYLQHYFDNLSFNFLFLKGDGNPKFSIRSMGQMYIWELPFLIGGLILLIRKREKKWWIAPIWIMLAIAPAAVARETPHALRIENSLPMFQFITAYGLVNAFLFFKRKQFEIFGIGAIKIMIALLSAGVIYSFGFFLENYFIHYPRDYASVWQYGYKEAVDYIVQNEKKYKHIFVSQHQGRPYVYLLYHMKYDPAEFREKAVINRDAFGFVDVRKLDKYVFYKDLIPDAELGETLFVDSPYDVPANVNIKKIIYTPNMEPAFVAYTL